MVFPWKMLVGPALLIGMKAVKFDYDKPQNLLIIRVVYALTQIVLFAALGYIAYRISKYGDAKHSVKVKVPSATGPAVETEMTHKDYDMSELKKLLKNFGLGAAMTVAIHAYMAVVPALILQMVTQPITLIDHALFLIYILKRDPSKNPKLQRPFVDDSPAAKLEAFKEKAQQERARLEALSAQEQPAALESDVALESDGTPSDVAVSDTQSSLSKVERRPRRAEVGQEEG
ncbi:hypothetical protein BDL97_06G063200 [Sphagnum fallax]|nr:hypothetical protein BDL97_06G063200 [Sphagnum fallax]